MADQITPVPGFEDRYGATTGGRIFSFDYMNTGRTKELAQLAVPDKRNSSPSDYRTVMMAGIRRSPMLVHRVVALTFLPNPLNLPQVNHIDGDKANNSAGNLEWCSSGHNIQHAVDTGLMVSARGEVHHSSKLKESDVIGIIEELESRCYLGQQSDLARKYGVTSGYISQIKAGTAWRHLPRA